MRPNPPPMHADELYLDEGVVRRLLRSQFPRWAGLPVERVESTGTVNAIFRVGPDLAVRLPRTPRDHDVQSEVRWLAALAPRLPVPIPEPVAIGVPDDDYPWHWGVFRWLAGEPWSLGGLDDARASACELASFLQALEAIRPIEMPLPPPLRVDRLADHDSAVVDYTEKAGNLVDGRALLRAWAEVLDVPDWSGAPVVTHGDILPANVLIHEGKLAAVIDWAGVHLGDPARDLAAAWTLFDEDSRGVFLESMAFDDGGLARARGWALRRIVNVAYYIETNPEFAEDARATLRQVLSEGGAT